MDQCLYFKDKIIFGECGEIVLNIKNQIFTNIRRYINVKIMATGAL